ncbi:DAK2 domain-containing protein, partial [Bacillus sp. D-CC]
IDGWAGASEEIVSPFKSAKNPSYTTTRPLPPLSTTPTCFNTGNKSGVRFNDARETGKYAVTVAKKQRDFVLFMEDVVKEANASLNRTPDLLPVLKQVGVVDSGGKGLVV